MKVKQIRCAATSIVKGVLAAEGYEVSDGDHGCGFDLIARKGDEELHVEVKGAEATVASVGGFRYLTNGEFNAARKDPKWELWVVENVGEVSPAMVTRLPRHEVLARIGIEVSWMLRWDREVQALSRPVDAEIVAKAAAAATQRAP
jgi:hypothetical protein